MARRAGGIRGLGLVALAGATLGAFGCGGDVAFIVGDAADDTSVVSDSAVSDSAAGDSESDASEDTTADMGEDLGADTGSDTRPDSSTDTGLDSAADTHTDSAADTAADVAIDTGADTGSCSIATCAAPFTCCGSQCVYLKNDILNCGKCGDVCPGSFPYCNNGTCGTPPCTSPSPCGSSGACCGSSCCGPGQICCSVPGPVSSGPSCQAPDPTTHTCEKGCPLCVCAAPDTPIATPLGDRPIASLRVGDLVYSVDGEAVVPVPLAAVHREPVEHHRVVRVVLANGRVLEISPRHPTADGRTFADLRAGARLDGVEIVSADVVPYAHAFTYDILPASTTATYFAAGARIGTTMPH